MPRRPALSLSLYLQDRPVLLVGTGRGADERHERLQAAGAAVERRSESDWQALDLGRYSLVLGNSDDDRVNRELAEAAAAKGVLRYAHDQPEHSDLAFPALVRRGPLQLAIATDGAAPALAAQLRRQLTALLDASAPAFDELIETLERARESMQPGIERIQKLRKMAAGVRLVGQILVDSQAKSDDP